MPNFSTYMQQNVLKWILRNTQFPTPPATVYISLHTGDPAQTGANEVTTTAGTGWVGYARQSCTTGTSGTGAGAIFGAPAASTTKQLSDNQTNVITFPASGGTSGTVVVTHVGIFDAVTAGNFIGGGALTASQTIGPNAAGPSFAANQLPVTQQ